MEVVIKKICKHLIREDEFLAQVSDLKRDTKRHATIYDHNEEFFF